MLIVVMVSIGCRSSPLPVDWSGARFRVLAPVAEVQKRRAEAEFLETLAAQPHGPAVDRLMATFTRAESARHRGDPICVNLYADVALECWPLLPASDEIQASELRQVGPEAKPEIVPVEQDLTWQLYHHCVQRLIQEADRFGLLDPERGILFTGEDGDPVFIEIAHHGFPWKREDFDQLHAVDRPLRSHLKRYWSDPGLGVPMVAIRQRSQADPYLAKMIPYAATGVLCPIRSDASTRSGASAEVRRVAHQETRPIIARLELHDPLRVTHFSDSHRCWDLARDISAPLGFAQSHLNRDNLKSFLHPGRNDEFSGLRMIEPYQPGKIPIVFVHGLLSDRLTWIDLINDLRTSPWFARHYQIWLYQYSTGDPFIISAAEMRHALQRTVAELDPQGSDRALAEMVLVGHSMGGLVSKLLITHSGDHLWNSIANRPIDELKLDPDARPRLDAIFFFEPLPFVKRAVFIGSPHQGSSVATSWVGKLGSKLVRTQSDRIKRTKTILHDNPDVFEGLEKHFPTSVDLLRPDNPILMATYQLPVNPEVRLHTIIGTGHKLRDGSDGDGVVPVESARLPGVDSELRIECSHTALPDDPKTTMELKRLLRESATISHEGTSSALKRSIPSCYPR